MRISIEKLDEDVDEPHVRLVISSGDFSAAQDSYISDEYFLEFGKGLQTFPQHLKHEGIFDDGSPDPKYYCYILLRAFIYDGVGHSALEVRIENHGAVPYSATAHFHILCEVATLNDLGKALETWVVSKERKFVYPKDGT